MKYTQKIKSLFAGVLAATLLSVGVSNSSAISIGDSGTANTGHGLWQSGQGGEFYIEPTSGPLTNASYSNLTRNQGVPGSFQTFCLEVREDLLTPVSYVVNDEAVAGGNNFPPSSAGNDGGDLLSRATSWLYSQFAQGLLAGYDYSNSVSRKASAHLLQDAIWFFEHEIILTAAAQLANPYVVLGLANGGFANAAPGQNGVYALNLDQSRTHSQDVLYFDDGRRVPDGGASIMLLGVALGGLGIARRFLIKKS
ncbi:MAG TPA: hypothetical protein VG796_01565 [Verrucomicrobiales bacterium]|jgi:hypothetical protein|nr:hypothetical protein [Verrucomicrobiales bacterium]